MPVEFDVIIDGITITSERMDKWLFSDPYLNGGQVIVVRSENTDINGPDDLKDKKAVLLYRTVLESEEAGGVTVDSLLMRMGEAAQYVGLSRTTLWRLIKEGRLDAVELRRGSTRLRKADLDRLCASRMSRGHPSD